MARRKKMAGRKKLRKALNFSIQDLWAGHTTIRVAEKLAEAKKELEKQRDGALETRRSLQKER